MRQSSVAGELREAQRRELAALTPGDRVGVALELGRRSLADHCARSGLEPDAALAARERRLQARRRRSACLEASIA